MSKNKIDHIGAAIRIVRASGPVTREQIAAEILEHVQAATRDNCDELAGDAIGHGLLSGWLEEYDEESFVMSSENKSQHTPGPWMTEAEYRDGSPYLIYAKGSIKIADLRNSTPAEAPETDAEFDANAALIAAAPELLEALEDMMSANGGGKKFCGHGFSCNCAWDKARAAISKAKGGKA